MKRSLIWASTLAIVFFCSCERNLQNIGEYKPRQWPAGEFSSATEINKRLGAGINIGAAYEAVYGNNYDQSPATMKFAIDEVKKLGFKHVRIPVTWDRPTGSFHQLPIRSTRIL